MKLKINDSRTGGDLLLVLNEETFDRAAFTRDKDKKYFTIAWNHGQQQTVTIDGTDHLFRPNTLVPLMFNQTFTFERPHEIVAWQFNREFYCIIDNDAEVSCAGFLFGLGDILFLDLDEAQHHRLKLLLDIFTEELNTKDNIQQEMLVILLKRLIITITKMARMRFSPDEKNHDQRLDIFRKFNLLVEFHFREEHALDFYAKKLERSAKTLSNTFSLYSDKTPLQLIQERIILEAKRLLAYTDKSVKQITYELGFEDPAYFSNFFKKHMSQSPVDFRNKLTTPHVAA